MSPTLSVLLLAAFVVVMAVFVGWMLVGMLKPYSSAGTWSRVATQMGLTHTSSQTPGVLDPGTLHGAYRGHDIHIERVGRVNRVDGMRIRVSFPEPLPGDPQLSTGGADLDTTGEPVRGSEILDRFQLAAADPAHWKAVVMEPLIRTRLLVLISSPGAELRMDGQGIEVVSEELESDPRALHARVDEIVDLAEELLRVVGQDS